MSDRDPFKTARVGGTPYIVVYSIVPLYVVVRKIDGTSHSCQFLPADISTLRRLVVVATQRYKVVVIKSAVIIDFQRYDMMHGQIRAVDNTCRQAHPAAVTVTL